MHYWLYLMETVAVNVDKFKELLAEKFELDLSTTSKIETLDKFDEWIGSIPSRIKDSAHCVKNFSFKENADNTINVSVDFEWEGISCH